MPVRKYLPSAIAIACLAAAPAFADEPAWPTLPWLPPLGATAAPQPVFADQYGALSGQPAAPIRPMDWRGFYVGGQFGYTDAYGDFSRSTQAPIAYSLRDTTVEATYMPSDWQVLGTASHAVSGFGGFAGYNFAYLSPNATVVFGVEANYTQTWLSLTAPSSPITRVNSTGAISITASGTATDVDFGTLRAKAGWAFGNFLPYGFVGGALGIGNINIAETTTVVQTSPAGTFVFPGTAGRDGEWLYGFTVGAGLDVAITRNIFARGEYEYVQFQPVAGTIIELNTVRFGAGIKF